MFSTGIWHAAGETVVTYWACVGVQTSFDGRLVYWCGAVCAVSVPGSPKIDLSCSLLLAGARCRHPDKQFYITTTYVHLGLLQSLVFLHENADNHPQELPDFCLEPWRFADRREGEAKASSNDKTPLFF